MEMFTFDKKKKYTAWVDFSDDEKYFIEYWKQREYSECSGNEKKFAKEFTNRLLDWKGVFALVNGEKVELECSLENKKELFIDNFEDPLISERIIFLLKSMTSVATFFESEANLKN